MTPTVTFPEGREKKRGQQDTSGHRGPASPVSKELKRRWSYFIRKVYETDPLVCPKCAGEMHIISFIDQRAVIKTILQHLDLWEESHALPDRGPPEKEITFDPSYSQLM